MLLNEKLNDTAHNILDAEAVHTCDCVRNSIANTSSMKSSFEIFYGEKPKSIVPFSDFGYIAYITKWDKLKKPMIDNMYKSIMVGFTYNDKIYTYKLYNTEINRVIMRRGVKW